MKQQSIPEDYQWKNVYIEKPNEGQQCMSKIKGEKGFVQCCIYRDGYFETYSNERNKFIITRWKHDLWLPVVG